VSKRAFYNWLASMIVLLYWSVVIGVSLSASGCATTDASYTKLDGTSVTFKSRTLFKDIENFEADWGEFGASLGSSKGNFTPEQIACIIAPTKC
jgi:hypothetical protein